jgi:ribosomal protein S18 acetylase RimI-like enzyme
MSIRPATRDDFPAIAEVFGAHEEAINGRPSQLDASAVDAWLHTIALETNTWLVEENGTLVAAAFAQLFGSRGNSAGTVRPSAWGRGLGSQLVDLVEQRMSGEGAERIHTWTLAGDAAADELFSRRGYREVRRFWDMAIDLGEAPPPPPDVPVEPFREEDARAFHEALEEAFEDHWEHRAEPFDEWWERQRHRSNYDPSVWFVIRDGAAIAAATRNESEHGGGGYIGALGVRREWRGRGYGRALLLHSFREFHRRGLRRVSLGVDAANPTGATRLYESVGMHVELENVVWAKQLG